MVTAVAVVTNFDNKKIKTFSFVHEKKIRIKLFRNFVDF